MKISSVLPRRRREAVTLSPRTGQRKVKCKTSRLTVFAGIMDRVLGMVPGGEDVKPECGGEVEITKG